MARLSDLVREQAKQSASQGSVPDTVSPFHPLDTPGATAVPPPDEQFLQNLAQWYQKAQADLTRVTGYWRQGSLGPVDDLAEIAANVVEWLQQSDHLLVQVYSGQFGSPLVNNLLHVSILATKVGMGLHYQREELQRLALAGLLHDVGMFCIPDSLVMTSQQLSSREREIVEQHPELGARLLEGLGSSYGWLTDVVFQEHERWAGQGYPRQLRGAEINPFAQIIGLTDVFDALISPRPYHTRLLPHGAVREMLATEKKSFSRNLIKVFVDQISLYPIGSTVRLNTGEVGTVVQLKPRFPLRPILRLHQSSARAQTEPKMVDLTTNTLMYIVEAVSPVELDRGEQRCS